MPTTPSFKLTLQEINQFHDQGFLGPFPSCSPAEMAVKRGLIEQEVLTTDGPNKASRHQARHLDHRVVYDICAHPAIVDRVASLYGPDLVLWSSNFWIKEPLVGKEIPWHQDINYWPIDPPINITAWMAIDPVTVENSCVRVIPGSHKKALPNARMEGKWFEEATDLAYVDDSKAINMELKPGEFFLFSERLLHHSFPNLSDKRRMGLSIRMTVPFVKVYHDQTPPLYPGHKNVILHGQDHFHINENTEPPRARVSALAGA